MPRCYFDIHNGGSQRDEVGTECADLKAARMQGAQTLLDIAREKIPQDGDRRTSTVLVNE